MDLQLAWHFDMIFIGIAEERVGWALRDFPDSITHYLHYFLFLNYTEALR